MNYRYELEKMLKAKSRMPKRDLDKLLGLLKAIYREEKLSIKRTKMADKLIETYNR